MRELTSWGRRSGKTTTLILTMLEEMEMHEDPVYLVVGMICTGHVVKQYLRQYNVDISRVKVVSVESLNLLRGVNPMNIYFEHTAYEHAMSSQLSEIFAYEDRKNNYIWSAE